jgi:protein-S-isoprenylcysteine O-methyltransferase Ste14
MSGTGTGTPDHGPGVRLPPPLLVAGLIAFAWLLRQAVPLPVGGPLPMLANLVFLAAFGLILWAILAMTRAGTDPRPDKPDQALVERGPFRFSRNPVYLGLVLLVIGFALRWGDLWGWLAALASQQLLDRLVIAREEAYLATRFGAAYNAYRARVRRWV